MKKDESEVREKEEEGDELRLEYDFSELKGRVWGKYAERYREGTNLASYWSRTWRPFSPTPGP